MPAWKATCTLNIPGHCKDRKSGEVTIEDAADEAEALEKMKHAASRKLAFNSRYAGNVTVADLVPIP